MAKRARKSPDGSATRKEPARPKAAKAAKAAAKKQPATRTTKAGKAARPPRRKKSGTIAELQNPPPKGVPTIPPTEAQRIAQLQDDPFNRQEAGRFGPGNIGGPGGAREGAGRKSKLSQQFHDSQLEDVVAQAWEFVKKAMNPKEFVDTETFDQRWKVVRYALDRAHGRPTQTHRIQADGFGTLKGTVVDDQVRAYLQSRGEQVSEEFGQGAGEIPDEGVDELPALAPEDNELRPVEVEVPGL